MLSQGPVDKNDGRPCQTWELTMQSATTYSLVHYNTIEINKQLKQRSEKTWGNQGELQLKRCSYFRLLVGNISLALKLLCPFHLVLGSIPCSHAKDSWKDPLAKHPTMRLQLLVQKFHARNRWQTRSEANAAQLTCLETNRHLEGMSLNFLISPTSHVTCSFGLRFLSCIEETKMIGLRLKHAKCSVSWKWPEAAGALLEVAQYVAFLPASLGSGCRFMITNATNPALEAPVRELDPSNPPRS